MATQVDSPGSPAARPSGTVAFLFSDIEGSTERWETVRDAMALAVSRHDALMHTAIEHHGGYIFKTVGDQFCAAFSKASDALGAAVDAQRALTAEDFSDVGGVNVRMALHAGVAEERDGDYFGPPVNRIARLLSIGHGGQILVSAVGSELLRGELLAGCSLLDLGMHRLKDIAQAEHVYQLMATGLQGTFPPLRSPDAQFTNLPATPGSFIGREDVLLEIEAMLKKHQLLTLVGTGGVGKTRCAMQVGAQLLGRSPDGVWFVDLSANTDSSLVAGIFASAVGVRQSPNRSVLDSLIDYLKRKNLLLIVDNCEHLIMESGRIVSAILRAAPDVRILATSRESLNVAGEQIFRMPSLALPPEGDVSVGDLLGFAAVALFVDRAHAVDRRFDLDAENAPYATEICRRLDGIPLAIELAAARILVLSPREIAQRLDERFRVLTGGDRTAMPRHRTMRALIDWSYDLLTEPERAVFRRLSIFAGGFVIETASGAAGGGADEITMLDVLTSLVEKSLVQAEPGGSAMRYRLLESVRQYARERLFECGEYEATSSAHAAAMLKLALRLEDTFETMPDEEWETLAQAEIENWRVALDWALGKRNNVVLGCSLAAAVRRTWAAFAPAEGLRWVRAAVEAVDPASQDTIARLDIAQARLFEASNLHKASLDAAQRALERFERLGVPRGIVSAQSLAGRGLVLCGRIAEGEALLQAGLASAERLGWRKAACTILAHLSVARMFDNDFTGACAYSKRALTLARETGSDREAEAILNNLAENEFHNGDAQTAVRLAEEALYATRSRNTYARAITLVNLAAYLVATGAWTQARERGREGLRLNRDQQDSVAVTIALQHLAAVAALSPNRYEDVRRSAQILGYVDTQLRKLRADRQYTEQQEYDKIVKALGCTLGGTQVTSLMSEGSTWNEDRAVDEAALI